MRTVQVNPHDKKYKHNNNKLEKEGLHEIQANFQKKINAKGLPYHAPAMQHMVRKKRQHQR